MMLLSQLMQDALAATPDKLALIFEDDVLSYREMHDAIERSAQALLSLGIGRGDRVAIFMRNRWEYVELYFACFRIGAIAVPLNHRFQTDEVVFAITHCTAKLLLADQALLPVVRKAPSMSSTAPRESRSSDSRGAR
ncbi:AMP-binding protein [Rhodococcus sp. SJ-3]|uniref:AMP-binding protein n=1 Tax=Rhodococcus sp. SJ-3 TaxID=3454628 RepID=UPI003F7A1B51